MPKLSARLQQSAHGVSALSHERGLRPLSNRGSVPTQTHSSIVVGNGLNGVVHDEPAIEDKAAELMHYLGWF
ncbi:hypothetical protein ILFOPFJJ_06474 [Ensifer psoraleae]|nr:hypothetical protein [Sinorhizobium psoraleae]